MWGAWHLTLPEKHAFCPTVKDGFRHNDFKIEAKGNKLDIKPNEKVILNVFVTKEFIDMTSLEIDRPNLEINGYINEVKAGNHFGKSEG